MLHHKVILIVAVVAITAISLDPMIESDYFGHMLGFQSRLSKNLAALSASRIHGDSNVTSISEFKKLGERYFAVRLSIYSNRGSRLGLIYSSCPLTTEIPQPVCSKIDIGSMMSSTNLAVLCSYTMLVRSTQTLRPGDTSSILDRTYNTFFMSFMVLALYGSIGRSLCVPNLSLSSAVLIGALMAYQQ